MRLAWPRGVNALGWVVRNKFSILAACLLTLACPQLARADAMADIKQRGEMVVGLEAAYVPYESFDAGKIVGYDCDLAQAIADKIGVKVRFVDTAWDGIIPALYAQKFDVIISAMTITKARAERVLFSMPYGDASNMILVRASGDPVTSAAEMSGHGVGAQLGSAGAQVARDFEATLKAAGKPGFTELKLYDHYPEAYLDLQNHRIDAVINSMSSLVIVMRDQPGKYRVIGGIQAIKAYFGMAFRKDDTSLQETANSVLAAMKADGSLSALQTKWFGAPMETPNTIPATLP